MGARGGAHAGPLARRSDETAVAGGTHWSSGCQWSSWPVSFWSGAITPGGWAYLALPIASAAVGGVADAHHIDWLGGAMVIPAGVSLAGMLVAFGRGAGHGRVRRAFWRIPPPWLDQDGPGSWSGAAGPGD